MCTLFFEKRKKEYASYLDVCPDIISDPRYIYIEETIRGDSIQQPIEPDQMAQANFDRTETVM
eukprot:SAG11_NODE_6517_length_1297_cov_2.727045_1_plen_62_part_10